MNSFHQCAHFTLLFFVDLQRYELLGTEGFSWRHYTSCHAPRRGFEKKKSLNFRIFSIYCFPGFHASRFFSKHGRRRARIPLKWKLSQRNRRIQGRPSRKPQIHKGPLFTGKNLLGIGFSAPGNRGTSSVGVRTGITRNWSACSLASKPDRPGKFRKKNGKSFFIHPTMPSSWLHLKRGFSESG